MNQQKGLKPHDAPDLHSQMALVFTLLWGPGHAQLWEQVRVGVGSG